MGGQTLDEWRLADDDTLISVANPASTVEIERDGDRVIGLVMKTGTTRLSYRRGEGSKAEPFIPANHQDDFGPIVPRNWASFRGQNASGIADDQWPPLTWDLEKGTNIRWRAPVPGLGNSCPVVWNNHVFLTSAIRLDGQAEFKANAGGDVDSVVDSSEHSWRVYCLDKSTGKILWEQEAHRGVPKVKRHVKSTHADCTPATDGTHLVVSFGSEGLHCYDLNGNPLWKRDLGTLDAGWFFNADYQWGFASSPILYRDLVIVQCDVREGSFIAAFRLADGSEAWRTPRAEISSWSTPTIVQGPERDELVTNATRFARGYDPATGTELWQLSPHAEIAVPTPIFAEDLIFITSGYKAPTQPIYAIRPGAKGNISLADGQLSNQAIAWSTQKGGPYMASPLVYRKHLYICLMAGIVTVYEAASGKTVHGPKRIPGGGEYTASPVAADGKVYFTSEDGHVRVMQAEPPFAWLADNELGEVCLASPAISDGMIFFRTKSHLTAIGRSP
jgi:outer membrane protein assembly factor BamB